MNAAMCKRPEQDEVKSTHQNEKTPESNPSPVVEVENEREISSEAHATPDIKRGGAYHYYDDAEKVPSSPPDKWAHLPMAEQIAEAIVECLNTNGECWIIDVRAMGFSLNDIARYWPEACSIAERKRPRPK